MHSTTNEKMAEYSRNLHRKIT